MATPTVEVGRTYVIPNMGVVRIAHRFVSLPLPPDEGDLPIAYVQLDNIELNTRADVRRLDSGAMRQDIFQTRARDIISRSTARQVLGILANNEAPLAKLTPPQRYLKGARVLSRQDALEMALFLRELMGRSRGLPGSPLRIPEREEKLRDALIQKLCAELGAVFPEETGPWNVHRMDCVSYLQAMTRRVHMRLNPAPDMRSVQVYTDQHRGQTVSALVAAFTQCAKAGRGKATRENPNRLQKVRERQYGLLRLLDAAGRINGQ